PAWYAAADDERDGDPGPPERHVDLGPGGGRDRERGRAGSHPGEPFRAALLGKGGSGGRAASARRWQDRATAGESDGGRLLGDVVRALPVLDAPPAAPVERVPDARRRDLFSSEEFTRRSMGSVWTR